MSCQNKLPAKEGEMICNKTVSGKTFIQIGVTALRKPTGEYLPSVPLFIEADKLTASGLTPEHEDALHDFAGFFIEEYGKRLREKKEGKKAC